MTYYKVVNKNLTSAVMYHIPELNINYKENEWTWPQLKGSKILVFDDLTEAMMWSRCWHCQVYECEVTNPVKKAPYIACVDSCLVAVKQIWKNYRHKKRYTHLRNGKPPKGTVFVDAIKLTKVVQFN